MPISKKFLETLLIDRALGELSPEASALIDAYLDKDPVAAAEARQISETLSLAKRALAPKGGVTLPPLRSPVVVSMPKATASPRLWIWPTALAATLVVGFFIGIFFRPESTSTAKNGMPPIAPIPLPSANATAENREDTRRSPFWSREALLARHMESGNESSTSLEWDSPVRRPQRRIN